MKHTHEASNSNDYSMAAAVARYVELLDVRLVTIDAKFHDPTESSQGLRVGTSREMSARFDEARRVATVHAHLRATVSHERPPAAPVFELSCHYVLDYRFAVSGGPEGDERNTYLGAFANVNGIYNVWPYFRELVQSVTSRMGLPPLVLPVYRVNRDEASPAPRHDGAGATRARSTRRPRAKSPGT